MNNIIKSVNLIYYSPTGTSRRIARAIGDGLKVNGLTESDITFKRNEINVFQENSLTVFVAPVYGGRISPLLPERIGEINGNGAICTIAVAYGNRHYADACTLCCACVKTCPNGARIFDTPFTKFLYENFSERKNPEFYF